MIMNLLLVLNLVMHPFHVSVTDVKYKEEQKAIQLSCRIFLDDLELGLREHMGDEKLDIMDETKWDNIEASMGTYLMERIKLWDEKGRAFEMNYLGAEIEEDVMWCYIEIEKVKKLKQVKISNTVLHEVWGDQENLVHFRAFDKVKSARLFKGETTTVFEWGE